MNKNTRQSWFAAAVLGTLALGGCAAARSLPTSHATSAIPTALAIQADMDRVINGESGTWCGRLMDEYDRPGLRCTLNLTSGSTVQLPAHTYETSYSSSLKHLRGEYRGISVAYGVYCYGWSVREFFEKSQTVVCKPVPVRQ